MKKLIPYILLPLLVGCHNRQPASNTNSTVAPTIDKKITIAQQFIYYLEKYDTKHALAMLGYWDPDTDRVSHQSDINYEILHVNRAEKGIKQYGINNTSWKTKIDTLNYYNAIFVIKTVELNTVPGDTLSGYFLKFTFDIKKSDTIIQLFDCVPLY